MANDRGQFYNNFVWLLERVFRRYFREVAVTGVDHIPADGGGVLVSWHPNGMIDPGLILTYFPRTVIFGARDGLFRVPGLGTIMKRMGAVPIYRGEDSGNDDPAARRARNAESLGALASAVADGGFACLFPEGNSHDAPHLLALKTGAARFLRQAWHDTPADRPRPVLLPVGLHYQHKQAWRSKVLVAFHPPITISEPPAASDEDACRAWDAEVTASIERSLHDVVHATESWQIHHLLHRVRLMVRAERAHRAGAQLNNPDMAERTLGFERAWTAYNSRTASHPAQVASLRERVQAYVDGMRRMGLRDHELDRAPSLVRRSIVVALALKGLLVFVVLPPFIVLGFVIHAVPAIVLWFASRTFAKRKKDISSIKLLLGVLLFPMTWLVVIVSAYYADQTLQGAYPFLPDHPVAAAIAVLFLAMGGLIVALRYAELAQDTAHSAWVRLVRTRRRSALAHLRVERSEIYDDFMALVGDLDLPGAVRPDGLVVRDESRQGMPGWQR